MNHLKRYKRQLAFRTLIGIALPGATAIAAYVVLSESFGYDWIVSLAGSLAAYVIIGIICYAYLLPMLSAPIEKVWQAVWHISPNRKSVAAPKLESLRLGRELVSSLVLEIYDLVQINPGAVPESTNKETPPVQAKAVFDHIPSALVFVGADKSVKDVNLAAEKLLKQPRDKLISKNIYDIMRMSFSDEDTLDTWLDSIKDTKVTDTKSWQKVRLSVGESKEIAYFDLSAAYSKDSPSGSDIVLAAYDKTEGYNKIDKSINYVAVAVHELRTPLTLLRGYIEVFEDELGEQLSDEHKEFMRKMSASAQTLTAFVTNILNVARIDEDQLTLNLREADWDQTLTGICNDLKLRANVRGKTLEVNIEPNLPHVAIDKISMYEVVYNLVENAIKYSGQSARIIVSAKVGKDSLIHTEVQDFGAGIPASAMNGLFTRYYRSHRSKNAVAGSGIGLYLVKSIVTAHDGQVWVKSKEGEGSTFGFSLQRFDSVKNSADNNDGIERQASGWIKNHSLYRR